MNRLARLSLVSRCVSSNSIMLTTSKRLLSTLGVPACAKQPLVTHTAVRRSGTQFKRYGSTISSQTSGIIQFNLADVGEGIAECEVLKWHVKVGDKVKEFDPLCEVQSDKATVEITSRYDGVVLKLHHNIGSMAKVGSPLVDIDLGGGGGPAVAAAVVADGVVSASPPQKLGVPVAPPLADYTHTNEQVLAAPAVRHIAKTKKIDLRTVKGSGRDGRILKEDILAHEQGRPAPTPMSAYAIKPAATPTPASTPSAPRAEQQQQPATTTTTTTTTTAAQKREEVQSISGIRRVMARTMTAANAVPHFGFCDEYTMDELQHLRSSLKVVAEKRGIKLTYMPFFIKAASLALKQYPSLNSTINAEMSELTIKHYHNIGVAMDTPHGLVVPNIKDVQDKSVFEIAQELSRLHKAAVGNQLSRDDLGGGTFTISNIGTIGGTYASPVLVIPEVVIGAIGKMSKVPRYDSKGNIVPVSLLQVSWSADHRVVDGATMANFSNAMKTYVEKPEAMLMDLR